jgi:hypothetical protein
VGESLSQLQLHKTITYSNLVRDFIDFKPRIALILYIYTGFMSVSLRCTYQYGDKHL